MGLMVHSLVRPAPRAFFRPDRQIAQASLAEELTGCVVGAIRPVAFNVRMALRVFGRLVLMPF
jgi:prolyl-tRNA editing enzyme YbaK/EbsC (Cys-tRNA(Pro) deacylase)